MTGRLAGRAAIVTGGSRGLGRAIALALAAEGAAVAAAGRTEEVWDDRLPGTIGETVADIEAAGGRAVAVPADLTDRDQIARLVGSAREALGPIEILINNAAFTAPGRPPAPSAQTRDKAAKPAGAAVESAAAKPADPAKPAGAAAKPGWPGFVSTPLHAYRRHFEIAVFAAYELMQKVCPDMIEAGGGSIINISSVASRLPGDGQTLCARYHFRMDYGLRTASRRFQRAAQRAPRCRECGQPMLCGQQGAHLSCVMVAAAS